MPLLTNLNTTTIQNELICLQNPMLQQHNHQNENCAGRTLAAIGSETSVAHGLSFFGNNLLHASPVRTQQAPSPTATSQGMYLVPRQL